MGKFNHTQFLVDESVTVKEALVAIDANQNGLVFVCDKNNIVVGLLTDGDIRRALLSGLNLGTTAGSIANKEFVFASQETPREQLLKMLDWRVKAIPILKSGVLVDLVTRDHFPASNEGKVIVRSRAPVRISFGGGGSDVTHFFQAQKGAVLNAAISLYAHATLWPRDDGKINISSGDLNSELNADNLDEATSQTGELGLLQALLLVVRPSFGFDLHVYSDFGVGSGLGGSASVAVAVLGCFNALRNDQWTRYEIAELAFQAERLHMGVSGGWQDQYAAAFGGINFMEFKSNRNSVTPLAIDRQIISELQENLILCNTGIKHISGSIHDDQKREMAKDEKKELVKQNVKLTEGLKRALVAGDLTSVGIQMNKGWKIKRQLSSKISSNQIDHAYDEVMASGALGGKLLGAGGGGYFLFFVAGDQQLAVRKRIIELGMEMQPFSFDKEGLCTWKVRL
ncbi:MAG: CBS domain-containing protein [Chloroflexota bacterium]|nr:CBS domain-containing protein [Chloroflexota bacterium]